LNDNRGFFSDAIHVYENFKQKSEIDYEIADEVPLGYVIGSCGDKFSDIYKLLRHEQGVDYQVNGCNYFAVAPLFLYLKSLFKEGGITPASFYNNEYVCNGDFYTYFGFDFAVAVSLLGLSLGHDLTYSCYYEISNLGIFNHLVESKINAQILNPETGESLNPQEAQELINTLTNEVKKLQEDAIVMEELLNEASNKKQEILQGDNSTSVIEDVTSENELQKENKDVKGEEEEKKEAVKKELSEQISTVQDDRDSVLIIQEQNQQNTEEYHPENDLQLEQENKKQICQESENLSSSIQFPLEMRKLTTKGKINQKKAPVWAHNEEEYIKLIKDKWIPASEASNINDLFKSID